MIDKQEPEEGTFVRLRKSNMMKYKAGEIGTIKKAPDTYKTVIEMGYKPAGSLWSECRVDKDEYEVVELAENERIIQDPETGKYRIVNSTAVRRVMRR